EAELLELIPGLWEWVLCVPPPPGPLRPARRRPVRPRPFEQRQAAVHPTERVLRALAAEVSERGYAEVTVAEIVERAHTSQRTFYDSFTDKEAAVVAALDSGSAQMLAAALPAFRRAVDWPSSVRLTQEAMLRFAAEEPEYGRLGAVEMYAAGKRALEQRERVTESMEELLATGFAVAPEAPMLAPEAIGGALYALLYDFVKANGPERLLELVPSFVYVTLAPFLGADEAYAAAVN
ncbi:MAG TPA: helix-turn-helix domain-containing protein, partial [Solirubrobacterales bacterium]|nr:helix-turn-helix domain-containing protein [Solirubrobacterales bacterium]